MICKREFETNRRVFFFLCSFVCLFLRVQEVGVFPCGSLTMTRTESPPGVRPKPTILLFSEQKHTHVAPQTATHKRHKHTGSCYNDHSRGTEHIRCNYPLSQCPESRAKTPPKIGQNYNERTQITIKQPHSEI